MQGAKKMPRRKARVHTAEFKLGVVQRMLAGEPVAKLSREVKVKREMLYRWREAYRKQGKAGLDRQRGRPRLELKRKPSTAEARIQELERKVGRQALIIDFLERACKRVEALRRESKASGVTASMERSKP